MDGMLSHIMKVLEAKKIFERKIRTCFSAKFVGIPGVIFQASKYVLE
jgi:hypothetical protein